MALTRLLLVLLVVTSPCQALIASPSPLRHNVHRPPSLQASVDAYTNSIGSKKSFSSTPSFSHYNAIVCGGGPAGLLTAIMLTQKYGPSHKIAVCERREAIPPSPSDETVWNDVARFYLLGIGHRGQSALTQFGVFPDFVLASVEVQGRRDWQPGMTQVEDGRTTIANKDPPSRILARDKLVGMLHEHLVKNYIETKQSNIDLLYGYQVKPIDFGSHPDDKVTIQITKCQDVDTKDGYKGSQDAEQLCDVDESMMLVTTDFLIGADGAARTVATAMEAADAQRYNRMNPLRKLLARPLRITKFHDDNPRVYKSVPIRLPPDWPRGLNYSARSRGNRITLEALPSDEGGNLCALLLLRPDDPLAQPNVDPAQLRAFFDQEFPQFGALVDDEEMARIAQKPASRLPDFRYAGPRLHLGHRTLVLGDAAHTVKPYYGLGANTALEDVQVLSDLLDASTSEDPVIEAVPAFSNQRAADAQALVTISRNMDRPGKWFFINFLVPIILDGIFHKLAPAIFGPNMFGMFQKRGIGFKQIQRKKRLDRALQLVIIGCLLTGAGVVTKTAVQLLSHAVGIKQRSIYIGTVVGGVVASQLKKATAVMAKSGSS